MAQSIWAMECDPDFGFDIPRCVPDPTEVGYAAGRYQRAAAPLPADVRDCIRQEIELIEARMRLEARRTAGDGSNPEADDAAEALLRDFELGFEVGLQGLPAAAAFVVGLAAEIDYGNLALVTQERVNAAPPECDTLSSLEQDGSCRCEHGGYIIGTGGDALTYDSRDAEDDGYSWPPGGGRLTWTGYTLADAPAETLDGYDFWHFFLHGLPYPNSPWGVTQASTRLICNEAPLED